MKNFHDVRFPTNIPYNISCGPIFSTNISETITGLEIRNINWDIPKNMYNLSLTLQSLEELEQIISFFRSRKGKAYSFRFKDPTDYNANNQLISISNGKTKQYQLIKSYDSDIRIINKPVRNTVNIFINGNLQKPYINYDNGIIIFDTEPEEKSLITASFEFDVQVRFDNDMLEISNEAFNNFSIKQIKLIEVINE